jgi:hypothetical protein
MEAGLSDMGSRVRVRVVFVIDTKYFERPKIWGFFYM